MCYKKCIIVRYVIHNGNDLTRGTLSGGFVIFGSKHRNKKQNWIESASVTSVTDYMLT